MPLSYRNQSIDLLLKSVDWFLHDNGLHHERVKQKLKHADMNNASIIRYKSKEKLIIQYYRLSGTVPHTKLFIANKHRFIT